MHASEILLLGLKHKVTALAKTDGRILWSTDVPGGGFGSRAFVTLTCDTTRVYAYTGGHLHALDLQTGRLLWTNELSGYGYGLASLCVPGFSSAPDVATMQLWFDQQNSGAANASGSGPQ